MAWHHSFRKVPLEMFFWPGRPLKANRVTGGTCTLLLRITCCVEFRSCTRGTTTVLSSTWDTCTLLHFRPHFFFTQPPTGLPVFLPRPGADVDDETDGVLLLDCLGADGHAFFALLDGRSFGEVARVRLPYRHCFSLGNTWVWS